MSKFACHVFHIVTHVEHVESSCRVLKGHMSCRVGCVYTVACMSPPLAALPFQNQWPLGCPTCGLCNASAIGSTSCTPSWFAPPTSTSCTPSRRAPPTSTPDWLRQPSAPHLLGSSAPGGGRLRRRHLLHPLAAIPQCGDGAAAARNGSTYNHDGALGGTATCNRYICSSSFICACASMCKCAAATYMSPQTFRGGASPASRTQERSRYQPPRS